MSRLVTGLGLAARACSRAPLGGVGARSLSAAAISRSIPQSMSISIAPTRTLALLPRPFSSSLALSRSLNFLPRNLSTSAAPPMRPTYFRDPRRPPPKQTLWQKLKARLNRTNPTYIVYGIIAINVAVFLMWQYAINSWQRFRDPSLYNWMFQNFILNEVNIRAGRVWTLVTSAFSHMSGSHIFFNCLSLYFVGPACAGLLGASSFIGLYLFGGLVSAISSLAYQHFTPGRKVGGSEGASGAIYATLAFYGTIFPRATFLLFFVVPMPAWALVGGLFAWDFYQAMTGQQSRTDSAGHAGGIAAGVFAGLLMRRRIMPRW